MSIIQEALKKATDYNKDAVSYKTEEALKEETPRIIEEVPKKVFVPLAFLIPLLIVVLVLALKQFIVLPKVVNPSKKTTVAPVEKIGSPSTATSLPQSTNSLPLPEETEFESQGPTLVLSGIMYLETGPRAIINGSVVGEGDLLEGGGKVSKITKDSVFVKFESEEVRLNLKR